MKDTTRVSHEDFVITRLRRNPKFAAAYLQVSLEEAEKPQDLLIPLRRLAEACGGLAKIAKAAGIERESLYRILSAKGNPRLSTLLSIINALGVKRTITLPRPSRKSRKAS